MKFSVFHFPPWLYTFFIYAVWSVVPWSWVYTITHLINLYWPLRYISTPNPFIGTYALIELGFSIYYLYKAKQAQRRILHDECSLDFVQSSVSRLLGSGLEFDCGHGQNQGLDLEIDVKSQVALILSPDSSDSPDSPSSPLGSSTRPTSVSSSCDICPPSSRPNSPSSLAPLRPLPFDSPAAKDFRSHFVVWFGKCKWEDIKMDNFIEWASWAVFKKYPEEIDITQLDGFIRLFQYRVGCAFPPGYNPKLAHQVMRLTLDPLKVSARPISFYGITNGLSWFVKRLLINQGFEEKQCVQRGSPGLTYLIRKPQRWNHGSIQRRPVPFICVHGLGIGLIQYVAFLHFLASSAWSKSRPVIIFIQPSISCGLFSSQHLNPLSKEDLISDLTDVVEEQGFDETGVEIFGHSNGTIVAAWIIKAMPQLIKRVCLVDPVCFCLWEGHVCHNFLYSKPRTGLERLMRYFIATELGVAKNLYRHFDWATNTLWPSDVPGFKDGSRCKVFLAGDDSVLDAPRVRSYLLQNGMIEGANGPNDRDEAKEPGLVMVWKAAHGESLVEGGTCFQELRRWLVGSSGSGSLDDSGEK